MKTDTHAASHPPEGIETTVHGSAPVRDELRPARGLAVGLGVSTIFWLGLLVLWLSV